MHMKSCINLVKASVVDLPFWACLALAVLVLSGCSTTTPRQFADGAPLRPAVVEPITTYTPAGAGLPEYWGTPESQPERSPHKRVLPETPETMKEPGIWSGDRPRASVEDENKAMISILGITLPLPPGAQEHWKTPAQVCRFQFYASISEPATSWLEALPEAERRCLAAKFYLMCLSRLSDLMAQYPEENMATEGKPMSVQVLTTQERATRFERTSCTNVTLSDISLAALQAFSLDSAWKRSVH